MVLRRVHCIHGIVTFKPKVILLDDSFGARGIGGKRLIEGNGRGTRGILPDFVRALDEATEVKMALVAQIV
jgi:hypothetical protein